MRHSCHTERKGYSMKIIKRLIILNPQSRHGKAARDFSKIFPGLQKRFGEGIEVHETTASGHATEIVRATLLENTNYEQIIVAGGDGTIREAVSGYFDKNGDIIRQNIPLGVIDLGTGGDFFRTITELSDDYNSAIDANSFSLIDYGEVSRNNEDLKHQFINISSVGLASEMLESLKSSSFQLGAAAYFYHTLKALFYYKPKQVEIECIDANGDTKRFETDLIALFVCNGRCNGGGMRWAPNADLSNGLLELTLLSGKKKLPLVTSSSKIYKGRISEVPGAIEIQAREVTVKFHQGLRLDADGEILSPIKEEIKEDSIRFSVCERKFPLVM